MPEGLQIAIDPDEAGVILQLRLSKLAPQIAEERKLLSHYNLALKKAPPANAKLLRERLEVLELQLKFLQDGWDSYQTLLADLREPARHGLIPNPRLVVTWDKPDKEPA